MNLFYLNLAEGKMSEVKEIEKLTVNEHDAYLCSNKARAEQIRKEIEAARNK